VGWVCADRHASQLGPSQQRSHDLHDGQCASAMGWRSSDRSGAVSVYAQYFRSPFHFRQNRCSAVDWHVVL